MVGPSAFSLISFCFWSCLQQFKYNPGAKPFLPTQYGNSVGNFHDGGGDRLIVEKHDQDQNYIGFRNGQVRLLFL